MIISALCLAHDDEEIHDWYSQEKKLYSYLLSESHYNKHVRPVKNPADTLNVAVGLALIQIEDLVSCSVI